MEDLIKQYEGKLPEPLLDELRKQSKTIKISKVQIEKILKRLLDKQ